MEKVDNVENDIRRAKITVKKNNGVCEAFSYEKLLKSLVMVDAPYFESERIVSTVVENLYDGISTKEIKKIVYECLEEVDSESANKYLAKTTLKVRSSRDKIEAFDMAKIASTLVEETGASQETAFEIATEVWKELKKLNVEYLTAPMIREIVNTKLVEYGLEDLRSRYTRLGIPVYNITSLIENGSRDNANMMHNPESIHKYVADEALKQAERTDKEVNKIFNYLYTLSEEAKRFKDSLEKANNKYEELYRGLDYCVNFAGKTDWYSFSDQEKKNTENCVLMVGLLYKMCKTQIVSRDADGDGLNSINRNEIQDSIDNSRNVLNIVA